MWRFGIVRRVSSVSLTRALDLYMLYLYLYLYQYLAPQSYRGVQFQPLPMVNSATHSITGHYQLGYSAYVLQNLDEIANSPKSRYGKQSLETEALWTQVKKKMYTSRRSA